MAILQPGYVIDAGNLISAFYRDAVSVSSQGSGATVARDNSVNFADGIAWGPASGSLSAQYPTGDAQWIPLFGGLGRAGNPSGNAWATANVAPTDFKKTSQANLIVGSNYSGNGFPTSTAYLYDAARNFLSVNWCNATRTVLGAGTTTYGPYKASFSTVQGNIVNPIGGGGVVVSVGDIIDITVGAPGLGGARGTGDLDGSAGGDGSATTLSVTAGVVTLAAGGAGGQGGTGSPFTGLVKGAGGAAGDTGGGGDGGQGGIAATGPGGDAPGTPRQAANGGAPNGGTATGGTVWSTAYGGGGGGNPQGTGGSSAAAGTGYGAGGGGGTGSFGATAGAAGAGGFVRIEAIGGTGGIIQFTAPGNYTYMVPTGTTSLEITAVGGGGGGGGGGSTSGGNYNYQAVGGGGGGGSGGYTTQTVTIGTPLPADVPQYYIASADDNTSDEWSINTYFNNLKTAFNSRAVTSVSITVCHSSCHSSCHGSRGRR